MRAKVIDQRPGRGDGIELTVAFIEDSSEKLVPLAGGASNPNSIKVSRSCAAEDVSRILSQHAANHTAELRQVETEQMAAAFAGITVAAAPAIEE